MSGVLHGVIASLKTAVASVTDAYWKYVSLLLNTTSTNGAQNNTFLDSSANAFTVTRNGDTTQGSFNPYMPTGYWSGYFDGTGDDLRLSTNAAFALGTGDFTFEAWINPSNWTNAVVPFFVVSGTGGFWVGKNSSNFVVRAFNVADQLTYGTLPTVGAWTHIVAVRSGTTLSMYYNGTRVATTTNSYNFAQGALAVGSDGDTIPLYYTGYISNARLVKGTAVYDPTQTTLTVPTAPLTAITNTSLLCLQDNRFIDNSTNAFAITRNGDTRISKFAPFNPPASYSTATYGGSGYFDGGGDFLALPNNAAFTVGTGEVTIEAWIYCTSLTQPYQGIVTGRLETASPPTGLGLMIDNSKLLFTIMNVANALSDTTNVPLNQWVHVVGVRNSSNNTALFVNGTRKAYSSSNTDNGTGADMVVGRYYVGIDNFYFSGYIANVRIVKGAAVYDPTQTTLTVPTTPLTAITNTSLLLNFDNAGIYDAATINDGQTVGNAQVSTTQAKFGTTSMYFDGTDDRLVFAARPEIAFGTGNFTIEGWVYRSDTNLRGVFQVSGTAGGLQANYIANLAFGTEFGQRWRIICNNSVYNSTATWSTNTWYHFALVRNSGTTTLYIDGTSVISQADTVNYTGTNICVGCYYDTNYLLVGYIQDFRITNGYARYTGNFTPPTAAFPTL